MIKYWAEIQRVGRFKWNVAVYKTSRSDVWVQIPIREWTRFSQRSAEATARRWIRRAKQRDTWRKECMKVEDP